LNRQHASTAALNHQGDAVAGEEELGYLVGLELEDPQGDRFVYYSEDDANGAVVDQGEEDRSQEHEEDVNHVGHDALLLVSVHGDVEAGGVANDPKGRRRRRCTLF